MTPTRRDILRSGGLLALGSLFGCASTPVRTSQAPAPFSHPEFAGILGVAREDIPPPIGIYARNWGAAKHDVAEGIHRPLTATALTMKDAGGDPRLVFVAMDLGGYKSDRHHVCSSIAEALKLDPARVMVNCSHTHSGPVTS